MSDPTHKNKALFLDRDGVINRDTGFTCRIQDIQFLPHIFNLCREAIAKEYLIFILTNQSGIARGYYTEKDFQKLTDWMNARFIDEHCPVTAVYHCPFLVSEDRKPSPGMFLKAITNYHIDPAASVAIGDRDNDILAARAAGVGRCYRMIGLPTTLNPPARMITDLAEIKLA